MKKYSITISLVFLLMISLFSCQNGVTSEKVTGKVRPLRDTVGFAQYSWQMDSLMTRMGRKGQEFVRKLLIDCRLVGVASYRNYLKFIP